MAKWKCDICNSEFNNFQAQGFDRKIYCPLCYYKHEFNELQQEKNELIKWLKTEYMCFDNESDECIIARQILSKLKESYDSKRS